MRLSLFMASASLFAAAAGAHAQTPGAAPGPGDAISSVQVTAPVKPLRIRDDQARQITGAYGLSNGSYLKVHTELRYIVATIDHDTTLRLYAVKPYQFVSADSKVTMEFNRGPAGEDMLMSYVPETGLARITVTSVPLARR